MTNSTSSPTTQKATNKFWEFRNQANSQSAELLLYGDISQSSWWGDEVTPKQFADDLAGLGDVSEITVRINSSGGDVFAADAIGNQLEQHPAAVTAKIDGLCASAATIVACHADKVIAANDAIYMVHPVRMGICDYMDATELPEGVEHDPGIYRRSVCEKNWPRKGRSGPVDGRNKLVDKRTGQRKRLCG